MFKMTLGFLTETLIRIWNKMTRRSDRQQNSDVFWVLGVCGTFKKRHSVVGTRSQVRIPANNNNGYNEYKSSYVITKYFITSIYIYLNLNHSFFYFSSNLIVYN